VKLNLSSGMASEASTDLFFDGADVAVHDGSTGGRRLQRWLRTRGTSARAHRGRAESSAGNESAGRDRSKEQQYSCFL